MTSKIVLTAVTALALSLGPALAQEALQAPETGDAAPMTRDVMPEGDAPEILAEGATPFLAEQKSDHWLTSNVIGLEVTNPAGETIGEVAALEIDAEGKVVGLVIEAGGFLGLGTKLIGVPYEAVEHTKTDPDDQKLVINATQDQIEAAPDFMTRLQVLQAEEAAKARLEMEQTAPPALPEPVTAN
jgi:sporulation protein YlmC with PRC-barrel domain